MWKFVTRGIRETLERRASCRTNVYSQTSPDTVNGTKKSEVNTNNLARNQKFLAPNVASCRGGFCGSAKSGGPKDKRHDSKWDTGRSWSEAVGWSSALAIGWVVCQTLCLRRRLFEQHTRDDKWHNRLLRYHGVRVPRSFIDTFDLHPRHVLPVTNCVADRCIEDHRDQSLKQEWTSPRPYGPITIEEALNEAKDDYTKTHRRVVGEYELRFGVKALEEKRYKDAVKHFSTGASLSSSGSMFNLGICHELGIGTIVDSVKAAKCYRSAADKGHPDAMYNLGVFHAQGRGGLNLDIGKARELFIEAASLGQAQARIALDLEKDVVAFGNKDLESESDRINFIPTEKKSSNERNERDTKMQSKMSDYESSSSEENSLNDASSEISYFEDNVESDNENPTDIFLNCLGIQKNLRPIIVGANDTNVPCYT